MSQPPFFIVGCARSGTTLLRTMLHQHPLIAIPVESLFMIDYLRVRETIPLHTAQALMLKEFEFKEWDLNIRLDELAACESVEATLAYLHERYAQKFGKSIWGQKTPRFIRYGELLKTVYPEARFIHIIRDPRAIALSLRRSNVHSSNYYYGAKRWRKDVQAGLDLKAKYPESVMEIRYETLVKEPEASLRQIADFLDIPYDAAMLNYQEAAQDYKPYFSAIHSNLSKPVSAEKADSWRKVLSALDVAMIEFVCMPLMQELGYEPEQSSLAVPRQYIRQQQVDRLTRGLFQQIRQYFNGRTYHLFYSIYRKLRLGLLLKDMRQINY